MMVTVPIDSFDGFCASSANSESRASKSRAAWVVRLRYAYADTLLAADRTSDALEWFHRTEAIDGEELTDAAERAQELEAKLGDA